MRHPFAMTAPIRPLPIQLQRGPFTRQEALSAGLDDVRLRASDLRRPFHGVRVASDVALTLVQRCDAYLLRMPPDAFFSGTTAARLHGVPLPRALEEDALLHVTVEFPAQWRRDIARMNRLRADGWIIIELTLDDLRDEAAIAARVRAALVSRGWSPR